MHELTHWMILPASITTNVAWGWFYIIVCEWKQTYPVTDAMHRGAIMHFMFDASRYLLGKDELQHVGVPLYSYKCCIMLSSLNKQRLIKSSANIEYIPNYMH